MYYAVTDCNKEKKKILLHAICGIRTHASGDTATWTQRLRPLGQDCMYYTMIDVDSSYSVV